MISKFYGLKKIDLTLLHNLALSISWSRFHQETEGTHTKRYNYRELSQGLPEGKQGEFKEPAREGESCRNQKPMEAINSH